MSLGVGTLFATEQAEPIQTTASHKLQQEGFDLREQARWKLERSVEAAVSAKRWDAAGVAAFALAEVLGGDDPLPAAAALMLLQVCQAWPRFLSPSCFFERFLAKVSPRLRAGWDSL